MSAWNLSSFERWYVYALFASQTRDMCPMPAKASTTMRVHHWVVVVACLLSLCAPVGFGLFVAGTFVLELGSMTFNLRKLYPRSRAVCLLYQMSMLSSNVVAIAGGVLMMSLTGNPLWMKTLYFAADVGVCIGRQEHALKDAGLIGRSSNKQQQDSLTGTSTAEGKIDGSGARKGTARNARNSGTDVGCKGPRRKGILAGGFLGACRWIKQQATLRQSRFAEGPKHLSHSVPWHLRLPRFGSHRLQASAAPPLFTGLVAK